MERRDIRHELRVKAYTFWNSNGTGDYPLNFDYQVLNKIDSFYSLYEKGYMSEVDCQIEIERFVSEKYNEIHTYY